MAVRCASPRTLLRETLLNYSWPGNVRELENVIKRFVILQDEGLVMAELKRARTVAADYAVHAPVRSRRAAR